MRIECLLSTDANKLLKGVKIVTTLTEIYLSILSQDTKELYISSEFGDKFFSPGSLATFVSDIKKLRPDISVTAEKDVSNHIYKQSEVLAEMYSAEELTYLLQSNPDGFISTLHEICQSYISKCDESLTASNLLDTARLKSDKLNKDIDILRKSVKDEQASRLEISSKLDILVSRLNSSFDKHINVSTILELNAHSFSGILYIKEITRIRYIDTLIYYLQEILRITYTVPARLVVIAPYYAYWQSEIYPNLKPHWELTYLDVCCSDIFMAGFQSNLMQDILRNAASNEYLIVLDRCGLRNPHIIAPKVEYVYTFSDISDISNIDCKHKISYSKETMYIPHIPDFNSLNMSEKLSAYSSMQIVKNLINLIETGK
jgi:hypothetical protein